MNSVNIKAIISQMSLEKKIKMLSGNNRATRAYEEMLVSGIRMADGPMGINWWCESSTAYPATILLSASWNRDLARKAGIAIGSDARFHDIQIILGPGVNIYRSPLCGRNFEYFGEDPYLTGAMASEWIKGCQSQGVSATIKHYALNFQEYERKGISSDPDERALREIYLPAFREAVKAGVGAVMTSYNSAHGTPCSEHSHLLRDILRDEWGFDGVVMSDWGGTSSVLCASKDHIDLEMPRGKWMISNMLIPEVEAGRISEKDIDEKLLRLLKLADRFGWFHGRPPNIRSTKKASAKVALEIAREGVVLLRNKEACLPLDPSEIKNIAVIGPSSHPAVWSGSGSAFTQPWHTVSILEGITSLAGDINVSALQGVDPRRHEFVFRNSRFTHVSEARSDEPGLCAQYYKNNDLNGEPEYERIDENLHIDWSQELPTGINRRKFSVRWKGHIRADRDGRHRFYSFAPHAKVSVKVNGKSVLDSTNYRWANIWRILSGTTNLVVGEVADIEIRYISFGKPLNFSFGWEHEDQAISDADAAVELASSSDVVVFCGGHTEVTEGEDVDRDYAMPEKVEELLERVCEVNPNTIVILTAGGAVDMRKWHDRVSAILHAWYPGQEGGQALAEILFGHVNPSGKLPVSFEYRLEDRSSFDSYYPNSGEKRVVFKDGILSGYRFLDDRGIEPLYPFGFGLSYTNFQYEGLRLSKPEFRQGELLEVFLEIINVGQRSGSETVQLYISDEACSLPRPPKELKGFMKVPLAPAEKTTIQFNINEESLCFFDPAMDCWRAEPGVYHVLIGSSSRDIRLRASFRYRET